MDGITDRRLGSGLNQKKCSAFSTRTLCIQSPVHSRYVLMEVVTSVEFRITLTKHKHKSHMELLCENPYSRYRAHVICAVAIGWLQISWQGSLVGSLKIARADAVADLLS